MDNTSKVQLLQRVYAGVLADTVLQMEKEGVLAQVTARKKKEQMQTGKPAASQFGIARPEEVFTRLSEVFNCAVWQLDRVEKGFCAHTGACLLAVLAKKMGAPAPCEIYCLNPMEGMIKGLNPNARYEVRETLWNGQSCMIEVTE